DTVGTEAPPGGQRGALTTLQGWRGRRAVGVVPAADTVGTEAPPGGQRGALTTLQGWRGGWGGRRCSGRRYGGHRSPAWWPTRGVDHPARGGAGVGRS